MAHTDLREKEAVLTQYDAMGTPFFEVWEGKQKKFEWTDNDLDGGRGFLEQQLDAIYHYGSTALFTIKYYKKLTDKETFAVENLKGSNTFKLVETGSPNLTPYWKQQQMGGVGGKSEVEELKEMLAGMQSQINALTHPIEDEDEEEEPEKLSGIGAIIGMVKPVLDQPEVQQAIAGKIVDFLDKLFPNKPNSGFMNQQQPQQQQLQTITEGEAARINKSIADLINSGVTASDFEKLAIMMQDPAQANFLLTMLRK